MFVRFPGPALAVWSLPATLGCTPPPEGGRHRCPSLPHQHATAVTPWFRATGCCIFPSPHMLSPLCRASPRGSPTAVPAVLCTSCALTRPNYLPCCGNPAARRHQVQVLAALVCPEGPVALQTVVRTTLRHRRGRVLWVHLAGLRRGLPLGCAACALCVWMRMWVRLPRVRPCPCAYSSDHILSSASVHQCLARALQLNAGRPVQHGLPYLKALGLDFTTVRRVSVPSRVLLGPCGLCLHGIPAAS